MKQLNLKNRILLGYLAPLTLMVTVCVGVIWKTQDLNRLSDLSERAHAIVGEVKDAQAANLQMVKSARGYMLVKDDTSRQSYEAAQALLRAKFQTLGQMITDSKQLENLQRLTELSKQLRAVTDEEMQWADAGEVDKAVQVFGTGASRQISRDLDRLIEQLERRETEILASRQQAEASSRDALVTLVLALTGTAMLLALALGWWFARGISQKLIQTISTISTSSCEIAATVDEHERVVSQQAAAVSETTSTVEELGVSARQSASQAESAAHAAEQALAATQRGVALVNQVSVSMIEMKQSRAALAEHINRLSEQAGQIGVMARLVGELASETNMLALNAAVEAVHAGEQGKGFAVVATEVRKLAEQSKKSAERANALVLDIQKASNSAVLVVEDNRRTASEVDSIVHKTVEAFDSISNTANSVAVSAQQVLLNSRQQAGALGQVTQAMRGLASSSSQMAAGTIQTRKGMQDLTRVAQGLQDLV